jgi:hypothetical protein
MLENEFYMHCSPQIQVYMYIRKILFYFEIFGFLIRNVVLIFFTWSGIRNSDLKETARSQAATEYCIVFWNNELFQKERTLLTKWSENMSLRWGKKWLTCLPHWNGVNRLRNYYVRYIYLFRIMRVMLELNVKELLVKYCIRNYYIGVPADMMLL